MLDTIRDAIALALVVRVGQLHAHANYFHFKGGKMQNVKACMYGIECHEGRPGPSSAVRAADSVHHPGAIRDARAPALLDLLSTVLELQQQLLLVQAEEEVEMQDLLLLLPGGEWLSAAIAQVCGCGCGWVWMGGSAGGGGG
eukprot:679382-Pelagomonas_calceolata.AAC.1